MGPVKNFKLKENKQGAYGLSYNDTVNLASKENVHGAASYALYHIVYTFLSLINYRHALFNSKFLP